MGSAGAGGSTETSVYRYAVMSHSVEVQFERQYSQSAEAPHPYVLERIAYTLEQVPADARHILEVGAGMGELSNPLHERGHHVVSMDLSLSGLKACRGDRVKGSGAELPFGDRTFDLVLCAEVIEHLTPALREATLRELDRVSRRFILVTVPNNEDLRRALVKCDGCGALFHAHGHVASFTRESLGRLLPYPTRALLASGHRVRGWFATLLTVRQRVFGCYSWDTFLTCPSCLNHNIAAPHRSLAVKIIDGLNHYLAPSREKGWLLVLFDKDLACTSPRRLLPPRSSSS